MDAGDAALGDLAAAVERGPVVEGRLPAHAEGRGLLGEDVDQFSVAQQRLRRNAADIEAHPAPVLRLDDCGVESELRGADGCDIPARSGTEDDDVIVSHESYPNGPLGPHTGAVAASRSTTRPRTDGRAPRSNPAPVITGVSPISA